MSVILGHRSRGFQGAFLDSRALMALVCLLFLAWVWSHESLQVAVAGSALIAGWRSAWSP